MEANKNDPEKCAEIADQLTTVALPFQELVDQLDGKQKRLATINKALDQYTKEKVPLEELITATEEKVDQLEPVGLDLEKDEADLKELEVLKFFYFLRLQLATREISTLCLNVYIFEYLSSYINTILLRIF